MSGLGGGAEGRGLAEQLARVCRMYCPLSAVRCPHPPVDAGSLLNAREEFIA